MSSKISSLIICFLLITTSHFFPKCLSARNLESAGSAPPPDDPTKNNDQSKSNVVSSPIHHDGSAMDNAPPPPPYYGDNNEGQSAVQCSGNQAVTVYPTSDGGRIVRKSCNGNLVDTYYDPYGRVYKTVTTIYY